MARGETRADMPAAPRTLQNVEGYGRASRHGPLGGSASQIAPARRGVSAVVVKCRIDTANTWGSDPHCRAPDNVVWRRGNRPAPPTDTLRRAWGYRGIAYDVISSDQLIIPSSASCSARVRHIGGQKHTARERIHGRKCFPPSTCLAYLGCDSSMWDCFGLVWRLE